LPLVQASEAQVQAPIARQSAAATPAAVQSSSAISFSSPSYLHEKQNLIMRDIITTDAGCSDCGHAADEQL